LVLLPKSIRQIIFFEFDNIQYKYVLFKDGHLSILKQNNIGGKFVCTSVKKDFELFDSPFRGSQPRYPLDSSLQENCRFLDVREFQGEEIFIHIYKNDHFSQCIWHFKNHHKFFVNRHVLEFPKIILKNLSGFLEHIRTGVNLWKFEKQNHGVYKKSFIHLFKQNVKKITSNDFEHYETSPRDVLFILKK
jgi:hypothetical protein